MELQQDAGVLGIKITIVAATIAAARWTGKRHAGCRGQVVVNCSAPFGTYPRRRR